MKMDLEAAEPLLNNNNNEKFIREVRTKGYSTRVELAKPNLNLKKLYDDKNQKDEKEEKEENKFVFKVYLHILCQSILILIMLFITFCVPTFNTMIIQNNIIFYIILIILLVTLIRPIISDKILLNFPSNYLYLIVFSICISFILCKIAILFEFHLVAILSILNVIEILYLTIESYILKKYEKTESDMANTATFMGLCILIIGSIFCFINEISIIKLGIILIILISLGVYIIYDMNCIFLDKRRKIPKDGYVYATMFLYIDIIPSLFELLEKFYNSCEPERKQTKRQGGKKSMIYTGDEDYENLYKKEEDEKDKKEIKDIQLKFHARRNSSTELQNKYKKMVPKNIINEEKEEENEDKDSFKSEGLDNNINQDKEDEISFKKQSDHILTLEDDNNNEE